MPVPTTGAAGGDAQDVFSSKEMQHLVTQVADDPTVFLAPTESLATQLLAVTKQLYDLALSVESKTPDVADALGPLSELIVDGFDEEQIWEELQLRNEPLNAWLATAVGSLTHASKRGGGGVKVYKSKATAATKASSGAVDSDSDGDGEGYLDEDESGDEVDYDAMLRGDGGHGDGSSGEEDHGDSEAGGETDGDGDGDGDDIMADERPGRMDEGERRKDSSGRSAPKRRGKASAVDDRFFKLSEMAEFLDQMDRLEAKRKDDDGASDDDDDEAEDDKDDVNLFDDPDAVSVSEFEDIEGGEGSDDEGARSASPMPRRKSGGIRYEDFYGKEAGSDGDRAGPGSDSEGEGYSGSDDEDMDEMDEMDEYEDEDEDGKGGRKRALFEQDEESDEETGKSSFEKRQERLQKTIAELEERNLQPKQWQMAGESTAKRRDKDALLEEDLEFETTLKPAPEVTVESTLTLEELIKRRIKDAAWDDVERKDEMPTHTFARRQVELDHEKSKKSLAEVYEDEYLLQTKGVGANAKDEALDKQHKEIGELFKQLCAKLDALSNFHFTPARPKEEIEIVVNTPAIAMEEVLPMAVSTHTQLAPEEVLAKQKREAKGDTERTEADRNYARKMKKAAKRQRQKDRERTAKAVEKANPGMGTKQSKKAAMARIERGEVKGATVIKDSGDARHLKSSTAFFAKLQDDVRTQVKGEKGAKGSDKKSKASAAAALKL